jgi:hypothetical protein
MQVLMDKGEVIRWAGRVRAYPILRGDRPELSKPGDDEAGAKRVGWKEFFEPLRRLGLVVVVDAPDGFEHRILEKHKAVAELPAAAFGPPLMARVWHEVNLDHTAPPEKT